MTAATVAEEVAGRRVPLALSDDERELTAVMRAFLAARIGSVTADTSSWSDRDPDGAVWRRMATEVGIQGLALPEELGGQGFGLRELALVFDELGRALCPAPMLGTVAMASRILVHCPGSDARDELLTGIAAGVVRAAVEPGDDGSLSCTGTADGVVVSGATGPVVDGDVADVLVMAATGPDGVGLYAVALDQPAVRRRTRESLDLTRGVARIELAQAPARLLATGAAAEQALARGLAEATVLLAAESVGNARAALDEAVAYAKVREQFGRPIGSFQALKHRMADVLIAVEGAWTTVRYGSALADVLDPVPSLAELRLASGVAKGSAGEAATFATAENIQIHGGIGFTWEHTAHLRFRRATSSVVLLGPPAAHRDLAVVLLQDIERSSLREAPRGCS